MRRELSPTTTMAPSKKRTGSQKSRHSPSSWMNSFLQQPELLGEDYNPDPVFVKALMLCHERFLHVVAAELVAAHRAKGDAAGGGGGIHRINASSVEAAMQELGMGDLLQQAQQSLLQRAGSSCHTKKASKRQRKTKSRQFTEEQIEEQERLLASSKSKVVKH